MSIADITRIPADIANTIVDGKAYSAGTPVDEAFRTLRREAPLAQAHADGYDPFWVVTRHADIMEIEKQADLFHNSDRSSTLQTAEQIQMVEAFTGGESNLVRSLVAIDGTEHRSLRGIAFPSFTPQNLRKLESDIRGIARAFVDRMIERGPEVDFAKDVAFLYPLRVVMQVLGVPESDEPLMLQLTQEIFSSGDPDLNRDHKEVTPAEAMALLNQTMLDLEAYFDKVTEELRAHPAEVVNSVLANATVNGQYLNRRQLMGYYIIAATAGHDTTSNTTAGALWALAERPDLLARLQADPGLLNAFVEESIRWVVPVKHFMRTATADVEIRGTKIARGDWLMLSYQSANRDEAVFADPFAFDIDRSPNRQISFGYGPHVCLGQHLARLEMRILWEELIPRLKSLELAGQPQRTISNFVCGPKSVPVRFTLN